MFHEQGTVQPPTEKLHQIIARTAIFVSKHGGQSEIILRVKQGDNPTFGFLMPDHHLHPYFRFLVDNPKLLKSEVDGKPQEEGNKDGAGYNQTSDVSGGALSMLGSIYGSGEDEDGTLQIVPKSKEKDSCESLNADGSPSHVTKQVESSVNLAGKDGAASKNLLSAAKEKASSSKRNRNITAINAGATSTNKIEANASSSICGVVDMPQASALTSKNKVQPLILEPPSDIKRLVDKIVEFVLKNGKDFESVLMEQDTNNGKFPFLLPSNQYHPYYLKVLKKAQESKLPGRSSISQKHDLMGRGVGNKSVLPKESDTPCKGSISHDLTYDPERKEKFKMVIGGPKKDAQEPPKTSQQQLGVSVDAASAAAILQAARRGLRNPKLDIFARSSLVDQALSNEGGLTSSFSGLSFSSRAQSSTPEPAHNGEPGGSMPTALSGFGSQLEKEASKASNLLVAKAIAKTAALAAASEADSSEAGLTKEQKQKAERLKRAKMFAAMIKSGGVPEKDELLPRLSAEPPDSAFSGCLSSGSKDVKHEGSKQAADVSNFSGAKDLDFAGREREGSSVPLDADNTHKIRKPEKDSDDEHKERRSRKRHRSRRYREHDNNDIEDGDDDERNHKHYRRKHHSRHSSHHSRDKHKHRKRHSSSKDDASRHRHRHHSSSEDENHHQTGSDKRRKSRNEREVELEDGEINTRLSSHSNSLNVVNDASREASVGLPNDRGGGEALTMENVQSSNTTEVPNELRAKVRAMLLATL